MHCAEGAETSIRKSSVKQSKGNSNKYGSFREAFSRVKQAQVDGWYFEAVTLQESILCDRLQSHLVGIGIQKIESNRSTVGSLLRRYAKEKLDTMPPVLLEMIQHWWMDRNVVVHQFAKSRPGEPTVSVDVALQHAKQTARNGEKLIREVLAWHRKQCRSK
jgi:hypothetical protein